MIAVVLSLQKENESESGDAQGEQADTAPCMHGDDESTTTEEERSREAAQHEHNRFEGESVCSAEQEGTLTDNEVEEESSMQPSPSHQPENTDPENVEKVGHSNNCEKADVDDREELPLPAKVKANPSNICEGDFPLTGPPGGAFPPTGPPGGDSPTASNHQEDVQVERRRSIVVPLEGSANESFEVILCGGEMDAPIAVMEAPARPDSGRKGKRKSKGDGETNEDGSLPSESSAVLKSSVKGVQKRENEEVCVSGDRSLPAKSSVVLKPSLKGVGKKRKRKILCRRDMKNSKRKQSSAKGKSTQELQLGSTSSEGMNAYVVQPVFSVPACQPLPFCAPSQQEANGTSQIPNSNFQTPPLVPVFKRQKKTTKKRKSKLVPSKQAKSCRAAAAALSKLDKMGGVVSADLNEVEVFSVATDRA